MPNWRAHGTKVMEGYTEVCKVNLHRPDRLVKAQLISAAPELLACCTGVLAYLKQGTELDAERIRLAVEKAKEDVVRGAPVP